MNTNLYQHALPLFFFPIALEKKILVAKILTILTHLGQ
jgi:hypothetical protein